MLFTHKSELLYLERARVYQEKGRVIYAQDREMEAQRFNFPYRNAQVLALGTGTSITNKAVRLLAEEGVVLVFTGGEGMPYIMTGMLDYHPNEYAQGFIRKWLSEDQRLELAKRFLAARFDFTARQAKHGSPIEADDLEKFRRKVIQANSVKVLMGIEGDEVRNLIYRCCSAHYLSSSDFRREHKGGNDNSPHAQVNQLLNHGNNLAYALAAGALWHIGIPPFFPLIHGQSRNGGLIFDVADLIKDGIVAPWAFELRDESLTKAMGELRYRIKSRKADVFLVDTLKSLAEEE
ncbi:type I-F CRISPR-associated endonuclease Cas1f [Halomonas sp.]|uniref:type I-F CRISPR-associated endonuclease Cas1f n=1 Tax=Halomonas sp. TaxID=1486246 RepID=UPI0035674DAF